MTHRVWLTMFARWYPQLRVAMAQMASSPLPRKNQWSTHGRGKPMVSSIDFSNPIHWFFPTSLCGVRVFRFDPAGGSPLRRFPHHSSQLHFSHLTHHIITAQLRRAGAAPAFRVAGSAQSVLEELRRAWSPLPTAAFRVAGAVHMSSTQSFLEELRHAWPPLARGCLLRGRHSTQSFLEEQRRTWPPLARGCLWPGRRSTQSLAGAVHRASWRSCGARGRRWPAAAFCVAGAVHRASWRSCGAHGRRWPAAAFCVAGAVRRASRRSCSAAFCVAGAVHQLITAPLLTGPLLITTHHNLSQPNSWQFHFSHLTSHTSLITSELLITTRHNLSHLNSSQLHFSHPFSHLTYHIRTHHSSTSHTSPKFTLKSYIHKGLTCGAIRSFYCVWEGCV